MKVQGIGMCMCSERRQGMWDSRGAWPDLGTQGLWVWDEGSLVVSTKWSKLVGWHTSRGSETLRPTCASTVLSGLSSRITFACAYATRASGMHACAAFSAMCHAHTAPSQGTHLLPAATHPHTSAQLSSSHTTLART